MHSRKSLNPIVTLERHLILQVLPLANKHLLIESATENEKHFILFDKRACKIRTHKVFTASEMKLNLRAFDLIDLRIVPMVHITPKGDYIIFYDLSNDEKLNTYTLQRPIFKACYNSKHLYNYNYITDGSAVDIYKIETQSVTFVQQLPLPYQYPFLIQGIVVFGSFLTVTSLQQRKLGIHLYNFEQDTWLTLFDVVDQKVNAILKARHNNKDTFALLLQTADKKILLYAYNVETDEQKILQLPINNTRGLDLAFIDKYKIACTIMERTYNGTQYRVILTVFDLARADTNYVSLYLGSTTNNKNLLLISENLDNTYIVFDNALFEIETINVPLNT